MWRGRVGGMAWQWRGFCKVLRGAGAGRQEETARNVAAVAVRQVVQASEGGKEGKRS